MSSRASAGRTDATWRARAALSGPVSRLQHARMLAAADELILEHGCRNVTATQIIDSSGVSRKTFYEAFGGREDCFVAVFDAAYERMAAVARPAYASAPSWREGICAALSRLLLLIEDEPQLARVCLLESLVAGERVRARRAALLAQLAQVIDRGRLVTRAGSPAALTSEAIVGGVLSVLQNRLLDEQAEFAPLLGQLMAIIVMPYLGMRAAQRELERPPPRRDQPAASPPPEPEQTRLVDLEIRVTYRTLRALAVVAEQPGASNREVAEGSGIADPGQVSKLLWRLSRLGLVENFGAGQPRGGPNAWRITARGAELQGATVPMLASPGSVEHDRAALSASH